MLWTLLAAGALVAWVVVYLVRDARENERHKRNPFAACADCGYDLTGSQGVCPECGRVQPHHTCARCGRRVFRPVGSCPFCDG